MEAIMKKSSTAVNLFRALIAGSVIFIGGYTLAQGLLNSDNENVDTGPYTVTFRLDTGDETTAKICSEAVENGTGSCRDRNVTAYYQDNFQTIDVPRDGKEYPYLSGMHIQWETDNMMDIRSSVVIKGRYVQNEILHTVSFYLDYNKEVSLGYVFVEHGGQVEQEVFNHYRALASERYAKEGYKFIGFSAYYASENPANKFTIKANSVMVDNDIDVVLDYAERLVDIKFYDENKTLITGIDKKVLYGSDLGVIPQTITDKVNELNKRGDGYYYLAHFTIDDSGVFTPSEETISSDLKIKDISNDEDSYGIGIFKKDILTIKFITTYNNVEYVQEKSYSYSDKHVLSAADFEDVDPEDLKNLDELTIHWPIDTYVGKTVDSDMVIRSTIDVKQIAINYKVQLRDESDPSAFKDITSEFDFETIIMDSNTRLKGIPNVYGETKYSFMYFKISTKPDVEYTYEQLMYYHFKEDATISIYYERRRANIKFRFTTALDGAPLTLSTYVGAAGVELPFGAKVQAPEGKYFTGKWKYSYTVFENGIKYTKEEVYDSTSGSGDTIKVVEPEMVLEPQFEVIRINVEIYDRDKTTLLVNKPLVSYGSNLSSDFDVAMGKLTAAENEKFTYWARFDILSYQTSANYIKGENGDTLKFYPEFSTAEYFVIIKNDDNSEITRYAIDGVKTVADYINQLAVDGLSPVISGGYEFKGWLIANDLYSMSDVVKKSSDLSIIAKTEAQEYKVQYNFVYQVRTSSGISYVNQSYESLDKIVIGSSLGADAYDVLKANALKLIKANVSSVPDLTSLDNYTIASNFTTFDNLQISMNTPIPYHTAYIYNDGSEDYYKLILTIIPKTVSIKYQTMLYDNYARVVGIRDIGTTSYQYMNDPLGYKVLFVDHFGKDKFMNDLFYTFKGYVDEYGNVYTEEDNSYLDNELITKNLTLVALYEEVRPAIRIFGPKTIAALDKNSENNNATFSSNYEAITELSVEQGGSLSLSSDVFKTGILLYIGNHRQGQSSSSVTLSDNIVIEGEVYRVKGVRRLASEEKVILIDDFLTTDIDSLTETMNYVLVLEKVVTL